MKTPSHPSVKHGFTLIELLVVIAIIAVLSAAGFAGGTAAMNKARKVSAQAGATSIATAIDQFYAEYSALPDPGSNSTDKKFNSKDDAILLKILAGQGTEAAVGEQNPRKIRFLSGKEAKGKAPNYKDGIVYSESDPYPIEGIYDPWGQPYYVWLDYDYDERLLDVDPTKSGVNLNGRRVAVYSLGVAPGGTAKTSTIVKTW